VNQQKWEDSPISITKHLNIPDKIHFALNLASGHLALVTLDKKVKAANIHRAKISQAVVRSDVRGRIQFKDANAP
jgi:hypothetical protein